MVGGLVSLQVVYSPASVMAAPRPAALAHALTEQPQAAGPHAATLHTASAGLKREVFGFALASSLSDPSIGYPSWNFSLLTTVAFFGLHVNRDGTLIADSDWNVWNSSALTGLLTTAHSSNAKVVLTIVLQDFSSGNPNMCAALINRATTITQTVAQVVAKAVDGVNVDYEGLNGTCPNGQTSRSMLVSFIQQLRSALPAGSYLSVDTYAGAAGDSLGFFDVAGLNPYVDSFFVMAYDLEYSNYSRAPVNCSSFCLGPTAPLAGYYYNETSTASQYLAVVAASKVILGVPYYGRKSCVGGVSPNAYPIGPVVADSYLTAMEESGASGVVNFTQHRDSHDPAGQERWDTWFNTSLNCTRELYWDDIVSLGAKYNLVNEDGLRGVGIWTLNYGGGAPELWASLQSHFGGCPAVSVGASPPSTASVGTAVTITATASGCATSALYEFWMLPPGSSVWQLAQGYSTSPSFAWNTTGRAVGAYRFTVWARDATSAGVFGDSLGRWDSDAVLVYGLASIPCASVSMSFLPTAATVGTPVAVVGTASSCPHPLYEFWVLHPGSQTWQLAQAYSTNATFKWSTSGGPPGTYRFTVWARDTTSKGTAGDSLGTWDADSASPYTLFSTCSAVGSSTSPAKMASVGTSVTLTAAASGCINPLYEFWILYPGSQTWQLAAKYSTASTFRWATIGLPAGGYRFTVWARATASEGTASDSLGSWDASAAFGYSLFTPCASTSASFNPLAGARAGATVTVTAAATGCQSPL